MRDVRFSYQARAVFGLGALLLGGALCGCGAANRAVVHKDDYRKVFPWPRDQASVMIRVKPQTGSAKVFAWGGEWENVEVTPETTFYITEDTGENFAYTPSRSPIRRLAPVDRMEIRWPQVQPTQAATAKPQGEQPVQPDGEKPAQPTGEKPPKPVPATSAGDVPKK